MSSTCAILHTVWNSSNQHKHSYLEDSTSVSTNGILRFFTYFSLLNTLIPISLVVTLECVKVCQIIFIFFDEDMYVASRKRWARAMTSTLNEELG